MAVRLQGPRRIGTAAPTDSLVVADSQEVADGLVDALLDAGFRADVIALSRASWDAKATSDSPHWRSIHQQARQFLKVGP